VACRRGYRGVCGPIDTNNQACDLIMSVFDGVPEGERQQARIAADLPDLLQMGWLPEAWIAPAEPRLRN
jgi:hypothetical protein